VDLVATPPRSRAVIVIPWIARRIRKLRLFGTGVKDRTVQEPKPIAAGGAPVRELAREEGFWHWDRLRRDVAERD
jgi:hypothetical protein